MLALMQHYAAPSEPRLVVCIQGPSLPYRSTSRMECMSVFIGPTVFEYRGEATVMQVKEDIREGFALCQDGSWEVAATTPGGPFYAGQQHI